MNNNELILGLVTLLTTGGGFASILALIKKNKTTKALREENKNLKENKQNEEINLIKEEISVINNKVTEILDYLKNDRATKQIAKNVRKKIKSIYSVRELNNSEIIVFLIKRKDNLLKIIDDILNDDFEVDLKELKNQKLSMAFSLLEKINIDNLKLTNPKNFLYDLKKNAICPNIDYFLIEIANLIQYKNGERRAKLQDLAVSYISLIYNKTIDIYTTHQAL